MRSGLMAALWFAALACAVFWRVVFRGEVLYYGDLMLYFHPLFAFEHEWLSLGILPLWNPHTLFGQPLVGNPQESLLYPTTWLVAWLGAERALSWGAVVHLWVAGLGVYAFARRRGSTVRAALSAGTLWCLCGAVTLRSQHVTILQTLAWYGWSLWAVEGVLQRADLRRAVSLCVVLALALLAGSPQMFHTLALLLLGWGIYRWRGVESRLAVIRWAGVAVLVALLLGGAHWLPLAELLRHTQRDALPIKESTGYVLRPDLLLLFLVPDLFGFPWRGDYMLRRFYWELAFFVGTVPLLAALARWRRAQGEERFWKRAVVLSLWMAVGPYGGLYLLAYYLIPGMQSFRTPLRWTAVTDLALCLWAATALEGVRLGARWWRLPVALLALATLWTLIDQPLAHALAPSVVKDRTLPPEQMVAKASDMAAVLGSALWRAVGMSALAVGLLSLQGRGRWWLAIGVTVVELLWIAIPANPTCSPEVFQGEPQAVSRLREGGQRLFVPETFPIWQRYVNTHDFGASDTDTLRSWRDTLASNIGMAHGLSEASGYEPAPLERSLRHFLRLQTRWREEPCLLRRAGVGAVATGDRADDWQVVPTATAGARAWMAPGDEAVRWYSASPQEVTLFPQLAGTVVLADSAYPGWRVWIDDAPGRWEVYDGCFRAVEVPAGTERVDWRYQPDTFRVGLFFTCLGVGVLAGMATVALSRCGAAARR